MKKLIFLSYMFLSLVRLFDLDPRGLVPRVNQVAKLPCNEERPTPSCLHEGEEGCAAMHDSLACQPDSPLSELRGVLGVFQLLSIQPDSPTSELVGVFQAKSDSRIRLLLGNICVASPRTFVFVAVRATSHST
jgi:hypothetical protein